eukprot:scaffold7214_cov410-Prasinococcus_capsulatus_cf.AAC.1
MTGFPPEDADEMVLSEDEEPWTDVEPGPAGEAPERGFPGANILGGAELEGFDITTTADALGGKKKGKGGGFETMGLSMSLLKAIRRKGYRIPTPIQRKAMPFVLAGRDVVAMARTGSGKTAAFVIPMIHALEEHSQVVGVRAVILSPTRELALQTLKVVKDLGKLTNLRSCLLVGGEALETQYENLAQNPDILIATPGRLMHLLSEVATFSLKAVTYVCFDEVSGRAHHVWRYDSFQADQGGARVQADRLFEMGFADQIRQIMSKIPESRQTLLFSATLPGQLAEFARAGLKEPHLIRLVGSCAHAARCAQPAEETVMLRTPIQS